MARKRKTGTDQEQMRSDHEGNNMGWDEMVKEAAAAAALGEPRRAQKQFVGVRQRPSGRWVAEIKGTIQKIRVWLGTFDTAQEAARAYDEAACLLRGANTRTNFWPCSQSSSSTTPALPSKITNLLLHRLKARNNSLAAATSSHNNTTSSLPINRHDAQKQQEVFRDDHEVADQFSDTQFTDFLNDLDDYYLPENGNVIINSTAATACSIGDDSTNTSFESCLTVKDNFGDQVSETDNNWNDQAAQCSSDQSSSGDEEEEEGSADLDAMDFRFVDELGSVCNYSPFKIAQEIAAEPIQAHEEEAYGEGEEPMMISEAMKRMKYERKFSATLYAFNGIPECLKIKLGLGGSGKPRERVSRSTNLRYACSKKQEEREEEEKAVAAAEMEKREVKALATEMGASSNMEGELSLWSSLDLPPICYVN